MDNCAGLDFGALERFCRGESVDAYRLFGNHYVDMDVCRFTVWAPHASAVSLKGDFNGWNALPMERLDCGAWTVVCSGVHDGNVYKYEITSPEGWVFLKSDPYAAHWETPPANGSKVWDISGYEWNDADYLARRRQRDVFSAPMSVYELHLGTWRAPAEGAQYPNYRDTAVALAAYCTEMGYTHVELLPLTEYPYEPSWGYQVTGYFAPTSRYGTPQDFKYFVDTLHAAGIGVIMDWVPAHFPRDSFSLAYFDGRATYERDDPYMAAHPDWGTLIFDYEKPAVQSFLRSSAAMFIDEYHIDGLRVDAVSSMLYLGFGRNGNFQRNRFGGEIDLGAVQLLRDINADARRRGAITIAEESTAYAHVTSPEGLDFTFKWDMGFMHDTLDYMSLDPLWRKGSHNKLTFSMMYAFTEHFILAFSHDEVVHGKKSMLDKMSGDYDQKFSSLRTLYGYQFAHPGKKHTFMGSDFGQFIEWNDGKELDWFLLDYPRHDEMRRWVRDLNRFYTAHPALWEQDLDWNGFDWLNVDDADRSSIAFMRIARDGSRIVCACNFTPMTWELQVALPSSGTLRLKLDSDAPQYGGTGTRPAGAVRAKKSPFLGHSHSAMLQLPPLSCAYYEFHPTAKRHAAAAET